MSWKFYMIWINVFFSLSENLEVIRRVTSLLSLSKNMQFCNEQIRTQPLFSPPCASATYGSARMCRRKNSTCSSYTEWKPTCVESMTCWPFSTSLDIVKTCNFDIYHVAKKWSPAGLQYLGSAVALLHFLSHWLPGDREFRALPLRAKFFRGNINIYLHFVSFLHIDTTQVVAILPQIRQEPTYST